MRLLVPWWLLPLAVMGLQCRASPSPAGNSGPAADSNPLATAPTSEPIPISPAPLDGYVVLRSRDTSPWFSFEVDGKRIAGPFQARAGKDVMVTLPPGSVTWKMLESHCDDHLMRSFELEPGGSQIVNCYESAKMGTCCSLGGSLDQDDAP